MSVIRGSLSRSRRVNILAGVFLLSTSPAVAQGIAITVQVLDGRNGKPVADQHVLVFTGLSADAVKTHAQHPGVTTDKDGMGTLTIYPGETQWLQVFADGRVVCYPNPNQSSFSVETIMSKGLATPNNCSALVPEPTPGHFIVFARPASFREKMKQ